MLIMKSLMLRSRGMRHFFLMTNWYTILKEIDGLQDADEKEVTMQNKNGDKVEND